MTGLGFLAAIGGLLVVSGSLELVRHRRNLARIPIRIHVNGTRGKSSVTRLIAAALRESGIPTCAKTTGTLARMILPDATEYPVFRPAGANIIEQLRIVRTAIAYEPKALVIECMAVQPTLQAISELRMIRSTHGVITNARPDHLDVMGPTEEDVARALAGTIPVRGKLFTAEPRHTNILLEATKDRESTLVCVGADAIASLTREELAGFSYVEHAENVALALAVVADLGVPRAVALRGMYKAEADPGAMAVYEVEFFGRSLTFVNGFAANDPESTERLWKMAIALAPGARKRIALVNCRADRADRSRQLGEACPSWAPADHYVLVGTGTYIFARAAVSSGLDERKLVFAEDLRIEEVFEQIVELSGPQALVMGMANIGGPGLDIVRHFKNRSRLREVR